MNIEGEGFRWDLVRPCKLCPFRSDDTRITFRCRERAEEIEEIAYRQGFVCHEHGETFEDDEGESIGPRHDGTSQHCAGALIVYLRSGYNGNVPFEWLPEDVQQQVTDRLDWDAPTFASMEDFIAANGGET